MAGIQELKSHSTITEIELAALLRIPKRVYQPTSRNGLVAPARLCEANAAGVADPAERVVGM